jgi:hypothetical protein
LVRLVLYCEGTRESGGKARLPSAPGERLGDDELGPAHVLTRRAVAARANLSDDATIFEAPLLSSSGITLRGSDLLVRRNLRRALTWPATKRYPDIAVVIVDRDGDRRRRNQLHDHVRDLVLPPRVIAVAVEEFEAWLLADSKAIADVAGRTAQDAPAPESLPPGAAKARLREWTGRDDAGTAHLRIAHSCDLALVARTCPSFDEFAGDLVAALAR